MPKLPAAHYMSCPLPMEYSKKSKETFSVIVKTNCETDGSSADYLYEHTMALIKTSCLLIHILCRADNFPWTYISC